MFSPSVVPAKPVARWARVVIGVFLLLTCIRAWVGPETTASRVHAQIPDSGLQRKLLLEEARRTNQLLSDIKRVLETGTLHVQLRSADNQADKPSKARGAP